MKTAIFVGLVDYHDSDTGEDIELEIWMDPVAGAPFAVDSTFLENNDVVRSPYNDIKVLCPCYQVDSAMERGGYVLAREVK